MIKGILEYIIQLSEDRLETCLVGWYVHLLTKKQNAHESRARLIRIGFALNSPSTEVMSEALAADALTAYTLPAMTTLCVASSRRIQQTKLAHSRPPPFVPEAVDAVHDWSPRLTERSVHPRR